MRHFWPDLEEVWNELELLAKIDGTKSRPAAVLMHVDMEHPNRVQQGDLQSLADRLLTHHRADAAVIDVVLVGNGVVAVRQQDKGFAGACRAYGEKPDTLGGKLVWSLKILPDVPFKVASRSEDRLQRRASKWPARISIGDWVAFTSFHDQENHCVAKM